MSINALENMANRNKEIKLLVRTVQATIFFFLNKLKKPQPVTRDFFMQLYRKRKSRIIRRLGNCVSNMHAS